MSSFKVVSKFQPAGDQPQAIEALAQGIKTGAKHQVLLGVTGSGKTFTMANLVERVQKPTLVISHNKTLAAQLYQEFKEFFPENEIHYFVSYYDYYQPEAYIAQTDTYIEKDAKINEEIDRLRHAATQALLERKDTLIVASVSCIYNIGSPIQYQDLSIEVKKGMLLNRQTFLRQLISLQFERNDTNFKRGTFRARGQAIEIWPATGEKIIRVIFSGDQIEEIAYRKITNLADLFSDKETETDKIRIYPAKFWVSPEPNISPAIANIKKEMEAQVKKFQKANKPLEAERIRRRTNFDMEMMAEMGYCHGIENYSGHLEFRRPGSPPFTLLDYFPKDYLLIVDESHITIPQIGGMYFGDKSRKESLIEFGFRLPSALDNRPLKFDEFEKKVNQTIYASATPGKYELKEAKGLVVEQLIRPTGLLDPKIEVRPTKDQISDLIQEIKKRVAKKERVLVTTLTKRMAEDLTDYLKEEKVKTQYLHSEVKTLERPEILRELRLGKYDVVVGVNLLREGLDLPEVSLVAILDADKEGFLRNETTLIQTIGRVSRHPSGLAIMYADKTTQSMKAAIKETNRRRQAQQEYNQNHNIKPQAIKKEVRASLVEIKEKPIPKDEKEYLKEYIKELQYRMELANRNLQFDEAMRLKEEITKLKSLGKK